MLGHVSNPVWPVLLAAMIAVCLYCARDLWLRGTLRAWCVVGLMNIAMIAVHLPMPVASPRHAPATTGQQSTLMGLATVVAAVEVLVAMAVLYYRTRGNDGPSPHVRSTISISASIARSTRGRSPVSNRSS